MSHQHKHFIEYLDEVSDAEMFHREAFAFMNSIQANLDISPEKSIELLQVLPTIAFVSLNRANIALATELLDLYFAHQAIPDQYYVFACQQKALLCHSRCLLTNEPQKTEILKEAFSFLERAIDIAQSNESFHYWLYNLGITAAHIGKAALRLANPSDIAKHITQVIASIQDDEDSIILKAELLSLATVISLDSSHANTAINLLKPIDNPLAQSRLKSLQYYLYMVSPGGKKEGGTVASLIPYVFKDGRTLTESDLVSALSSIKELAPFFKKDKKQEARPLEPTQLPVAALYECALALHVALIHGVSGTYVSFLSDSLHMSVSLNTTTQALLLVCDAQMLYAATTSTQKSRLSRANVTMHVSCLRKCVEAATLFLNGEICGHLHLHFVVCFAFDLFKVLMQIPAQNKIVYDSIVALHSALDHIQTSDNRLFVQLASLVAELSLSEDMVDSARNLTGHALTIEVMGNKGVHSELLAINHLSVLKSNMYVIPDKPWERALVSLRKLQGLTHPGLKNAAIDSIMTELLEEKSRCLALKAEETEIELFDSSMAFDVTTRVIEACWSAPRCPQFVDDLFESMDLFYESIPEKSLKHEVRFCDANIIRAEVMLLRRFEQMPMNVSMNDEYLPLSLLAKALRDVALMCKGKENMQTVLMNVCTMLLNHCSPVFEAGLFFLIDDLYPTLLEILDVIQGFENIGKRNPILIAHIFSIAITAGEQAHYSIAQVDAKPKGKAPKGKPPKGKPPKGKPKQPVEEEQAVEEPPEPYAPEFDSAILTITNHFGFFREKQQAFPAAEITLFKKLFGMIDIDEGKEYLFIDLVSNLARCMHSSKSFSADFFPRLLSHVAVSEVYHITHELSDFSKTTSSFITPILEGDQLESLNVICCLLPVVSALASDNALSAHQMGASICEKIYAALEEQDVSSTDKNVANAFVVVTTAYANCVYRMLNMSQTEELRRRKLIGVLQQIAPAIEAACSQTDGVSLAALIDYANFILYHIPKPLPNTLHDLLKRMCTAFLRFSLDNRDEFMNDTPELYESRVCLLLYFLDTVQSNLLSGISLDEDEDGEQEEATMLIDTAFPVIPQSLHLPLLSTYAFVAAKANRPISSILARLSVLQAPVKARVLGSFALHSDFTSQVLDAVSIAVQALKDEESLTEKAQLYANYAQFVMRANIAAGVSVEDNDKSAGIKSACEILELATNLLLELDEFYLGVVFDESGSNERRNTAMTEAKSRVSRFSSRTRSTRSRFSKRSSRKMGSIASMRSSMSGRTALTLATSRKSMLQARVGDFEVLTLSQLSMLASLFVQRGMIETANVRTYLRCATWAMDQMIARSCHCLNQMENGDELPTFFDEANERLIVNQPFDPTDDELLTDEFLEKCRDPSAAFDQWTVNRRTVSPDVGISYFVILIDLLFEHGVHFLLPSVIRVLDIILQNNIYYSAYRAVVMTRYANVELSEEDMSVIEIAIGDAYSLSLRGSATDTAPTHIHQATPLSPRHWLNHMASFLIKMGHVSMAEECVSVVTALCKCVNDEALRRSALVKSAWLSARRWLLSDARSDLAEITSLHEVSFLDKSLYESAYNAVLSSEMGYTPIGEYAILERLRFCLISGSADVYKEVMIEFIPLFGTMVQQDVLNAARLLFNALPSILELFIGDFHPSIVEDICGQLAIITSELSQKLNRCSRTTAGRGIIEDYFMMSVIVTAILTLGLPKIEIVEFQNAGAYVFALLNDIDRDSITIQPLLKIYDVLSHLTRFYLNDEDEIKTDVSDAIKDIMPITSPDPRWQLHLLRINAFLCEEVCTVCPSFLQLAHDIQSSFDLLKLQLSDERINTRDSATFACSNDWFVANIIEYTPWEHRAVYSPPMQRLFGVKLMALDRNRVFVSIVKNSLSVNLIEKTITEPVADKKDKKKKSKSRVDLAASQESNIEKKTKVVHKELLNVAFDNAKFKAARNEWYENLFRLRSTVATALNDEMVTEMYEVMQESTDLLNEFVSEALQLVVNMYTPLTENPEPEEIPPIDMDEFDVFFTPALVITGLSTINGVPGCLGVSSCLSASNETENEKEKEKKTKDEKYTVLVDPTRHDTESVLAPITSTIDLRMPSSSCMQRLLRTNQLLFLVLMGTLGDRITPNDLYSLDISGATVVIFDRIYNEGYNRFQSPLDVRKTNSALELAYPDVMTLSLIARGAKIVAMPLYPRNIAKCAPLLEDYDEMGLECLNLGEIPTIRIGN
ncbi:hypothetical protein PCE1_002172 [Barthelona sp. PCE]